MKNIQYVSKKIIIWGIIPLILFSLGLFLAMLFNPDLPFSVITQDFGKEKYTKYTTNELLAHQKVQGEFIANNDNLGIIAVRFTTYIRINSDILAFRLKEKGSRQWYYENRYKVDQFQPNQLFTFGFPIIHASKGKAYIFEIESLKGTPGDAISINTSYPSFVVRYQFSRSNLLHYHEQLLKFLPQKISNSFTDINFLFYLMVYLLPLSVYIFWLLLDLKFPASNMLIQPFLLLIFISVVFINTDQNDLILAIFTAFWIAIVMHHKFKGSVSFFLLIIFFIIVICASVMRAEQIAEKAAVWCYIFLVIATTQTILEKIGIIHGAIDYERFVSESISLKMNPYKN